MTSLDFTTPWSTKKNYDPFHSLCSYLGAFPPALASYFIKYFTDEGDLVFDPFAGRGTTLLEARILNRRAVSSDLNPIALALNRAKAVSLNLEQINERISKLENSYDYALFLPEAEGESDEIHLIYHPRTLAQLCFLRSVLLPSSQPVDHYLIGAILGIMHGSERKNGTSGYLSISMPNTFSMAPEYVRRFVQTKQLNREYRNVFQLLREKSDRTFKHHAGASVDAEVFECDARTVSSKPEVAKYLNKVNMVLTSPPYLGIVNYAKQNWIRSWFLKSNPNEVSERLDDDLNLFEWIKFSRESLTEIKRLLQPNGVAILVIGDVARSKDSVIPLAREFARMVKETNLFKNIWVFSDYILNDDKTTRIWGETKGKATGIDRIVILSDIDPFVGNQRMRDENIIPPEIIFRSTREFIGESASG
jgi:site-specific DNA-methyltransferase (adenine-specific)